MAAFNFCIECVDPADCASWQACERPHAFAPHNMITERGEIDRAYLVKEARKRAARDYGAANPPPAWVRPHILNLETDAYFLRRNWRADRGLRPDTILVLPADTMIPGFQVIEPRRVWA